MAKGRDEIEVKIPIVDAAAVRRRMRELGYRVDRPRRRESNWIFDRDDTLLRQGKLLRLRLSGSSWTITYKGPRQRGPLKRRREIEVELADGRMARSLIEHIGFRPRVRYDRFRTRFTARAAAGELDWDETPMGIYLELEGPAAWIRRTVRDLGLSLDQVEQRSYPELYLAWRHRRTRAGRAAARR